ncbi:MAG: DMT family transporter [Desulfobacterales bacterium]|nr:DMT family transporter [Desulfobacterales bacterium]
MGKGVNNFGVPYLLLTLAILFWSGNTVVGRAVRAEIPPLAFAFWRWFTAAIIILFLAIPHLRRDWAVIRRSWPILLLLSAIGIASFNALLYSGLQWTTAINSFLLQAMMPAFIVWLSFLIFREKVTSRQIVGLVICLAGAIVIITNGNPALLVSLSFNLGDIYIFTAVMLYAGYSVLLRLRPPVHDLTFMAATFALGTLLLLPLYLWETFAGRSIEFNRTSFMAVGYVALFPSIVSYFCFNRGIALVGANRGGMFLYLMPVFGSILAIVFLDETIRWFHFAGIGLILPGLVLAARK